MELQTGQVVFNTGGLQIQEKETHLASRLNPNRLEIRQPEWTTLSVTHFADRQASRRTFNGS